MTKTLFIDADALPQPLKPILFRAIVRKQITTFVVANKAVSIGDSEFIHYEIVKQGPDEADNVIADKVKEGDLIITSDIPLADRVVTKGAVAIDHRGKEYTAENIKTALAMRNLMSEIRESGGTTKGPAPFSPKDAGAFAATLDRYLTKLG